MTSNHLETLSAFFDGEAVDADSLADALREAKAIDFLVDSARLRRSVHADASRPSEEFCETMRETLGRAESGRASRRRLLRLALAASLALATGLGGFGVRSLLDSRIPPRSDSAIQATQRPDVPLDTSRNANAPLARDRPTATPKPARTTVPSPTLRIRFDEWHDTVL